MTTIPKGFGRNDKHSARLKVTYTPSIAYIAYTLFKTKSGKFSFFFNFEKRVPDVIFSVRMLRFADDGEGLDQCKRFHEARMSPAHDTYRTVV